MKTVLMTGATGFVGRQILKALIGSGVKIVLVIRSGKEYIFKGIPDIERLITSRDIFWESEDWWKNQCEGIDIFIHAAWYTEPGRYLRSTLNVDCLIGSLTLAKGAVKAGVKRFIGLGTCFEYDLSAGVLSTDTPLNPITPYAGAKAALYLTLAQYLPEQSVEFAWCRLFYLHGEGEHESRLVPYIHKQLDKGEAVELTSGKQIRDFIEVSEASRIIAKIAVSDKQGAINVCSGVPITVRQLAEQIADQYGRHDLLKFGVRQDNYVDPPCVLGVPNHFT